MAASLHPGELASAATRQIAPYQPGKPINELQRELGLRDIVKLASNENPFGPGTQVVAAMQAAVAGIGLYPDGSGHELKSALAVKFGLSAAQITLGNGSNDLLVLLAEAFLQPQFEAVCSQYCFAVYPLAVQATGATLRQVPARNFGHDLDAMRAAITEHTRLVFVANPNNPTGTAASAAELESFVAACPASTLVILDEAYFEYGRDAGLQDGLKWLGLYANLVVTRTFSKAYGLAGIRLGFAASHPEVADMLNRIRQPFNVNSIALVAGLAALADDAHIARCVQAARAGREALQRALQARGFASVPSSGNFLLVEFGAAAANVNQALLKRGIIVRPTANYGLPNHLRITIGRPDENEKLMAALDAVSAELSL